MTRKILVVDDNAIIRHSTALLVNGFGELTGTRFFFIVSRM
jgi:CheY-like chemotaxis protein